MTKTIACCLVSLALVSCERSWDGSQIARDRVDLDVPAGVDAGADCNCNKPPAADERADLSTIDLRAAPAKGLEAARVTLVVFYDFECPFCRRLQKTLDELEATYGSSIRVVYKQLPLPFHLHAREVAKVSMIAQDQGKFFPFYDAVLADKTELDPDEVDRLAQSVGVDLSRSKIELASPELEQRLERDLADAHRLGARGTPTVFVNGKRIVGAQPYDVFASAIDEALGEGR